MSTSPLFSQELSLTDCSVENQQVAGPILVLPAVLISYLTPAKAGGGGGGILAKDALGNDVVVEDWIKVKFSSLSFDVFLSMSICDPTSCPQAVCLVQTPPASPQFVSK